MVNNEARRSKLFKRKIRKRRDNLRVVQMKQNETLTLRVNNKIKRQLENKATREKITVGALIRKYIDQGLKESDNA